MKLSKEVFVEEYNKAFTGNILEFHRYLSKTHGVDKSNFSQTYRRINKLKASGELQLEAGVSVEKGTILTGMSRYHKLVDGAVWVKSDVTKENQLEALKTAVNKIMTKAVSPKVYTSPLADTLKDELMVVYTIGDAHIGMLAHKAESGADNDMKIAEADLLGAMNILVKQSPSSEECFIVDVGEPTIADVA